MKIKNYLLSINTVFAGKVTILLIIGQIIFPKPALAYLDPGTGSYLVQIFAASLFAGLYMIKRFWTNIKDFFAYIFSRSKRENTKNNTNEDK